MGSGQADRFAPGREEHRRARFSVISFGGGEHGCIGRSFAYLEIKALWSELLRRFELRLLDPKARPSSSPVLGLPRSPCRVVYRRRSVSRGLT